MKEEERVTLVVAMVTAESPACTINRASCDMLKHMALLKYCSISIARRLNGHAKQAFKMHYQHSIFSTQLGDSACFTKQ